MSHVTKAKPDQPLKDAPHANAPRHIAKAVPADPTRKGVNRPRFAGGMSMYDPSLPTSSPNPATQDKGLATRQPLTTKPVSAPVEKENWSSVEDKSPLPEAKEEIVDDGSNPDQGDNEEEALPANDEVPETDKSEEEA